MPEGPEVRLVTDGLAKKIVGHKIVRAEILSGRYSKKPPEGWDLLQSSLPLDVK